MTNHPNRSRTCRPREHLRAAGQLYPHAWNQFDEFRARRGKDLPAWPDWCYCPVAGAYAVVSGGGKNRVPLLNQDVGPLAALAAWRVGQGIYRFDSSLYDDLISTPVSGDLPCDVLFKLPEWCVYIETPNASWFGIPLHGFFAHLEWDANNGREELRLVMDSEELLQLIPLHIGAWTLADAVLNSTKESLRRAKVRIPKVGDENLNEAVQAIEPYVSLLLYLCAENAEISNGTAHPERPKPKKTKKGWRLFPPDKPQIWDVGVRMGAALRRAQASTPIDSSEANGTHASPRPHIRRAHWHTFKVGPGRQESRLKWLPPIPVNLDNPDELPATIRTVK